MTRKPLLLSLLILAAIAFYVTSRRFVSLEEVISYETQLRDWVDHFPGRSFLIGLVIYTLMSFVPGTTGKSIIYGWLFGFWIAFIQVNLALTTAAMGCFWLSRYFLRDAIQSKFGYYINRFNKTLSRSGGTFIATLRLMHVPYTLVNYSMGATSVRSSTFWWSTQLGLLPSNAVFVLAGAQLPTLRVLSQEGIHSVWTPQLITAFALMAFFPMLIHAVVGRWNASRGEDLSDLTP